MTVDLHAERVLLALQADGVRHAQPSSVMASWRRCADLGLEPHRFGRPPIITSSELRNALTPLEELLRLATPEVNRLFALLSAARPMLMLSDAGGRTLMLRCAEATTNVITLTGCSVGSVFSEDTVGTNGIGTCIAEKSTLSIITGEHFNSTLIGLSCTVAPIFGAHGELAAVLNVTTAEPTSSAMHAVLRDIVTGVTTKISNLWLSSRNRSAKVLRLSRFEDFGDLNTEARVALDSAGRIVDATVNFSDLIADASGARLRESPQASQLLGLSDGELWRSEAAVVPLRQHDGSLLFARMCADPVTPAAAARPGSARGPRPAVRATEDGELAGLANHSPELKRQVAVARRLIDRRLPILLQGETGTGKSALAKALHQGSVHRQGAFVSINCAAIPQGLIESELFGYKAGAFTGSARAGSKGRILEAQHGTLFLDEIGDMPLVLQSRLLHVLAENEVVPVGGTQPVPVSFALVSATLHDLETQVRAGNFREDLYHRLTGATLRLPALRHRGDRSSLIDQILLEEAEAAGRPPLRLDQEVRDTFAKYLWPGNIRELRHTIKFAVAVCEQQEIGLADLPDRFLSARVDRISLRRHAERQTVVAALVETAWNVSLAAQRLGVSRATLHRKILLFDLQRPDA